MNDLIDKFLALIRGDVVILQRFFQKQIDETSSLKSEVANLAKEVKNQKPPVVNVPAPKVQVNVPDVKVPEIKIPEIKLPVFKVPEVKVTIPPIIVPKPEVTVNLPPIKLPKPEKPIINIEPKVEVKIPKEMTVEGFKEFTKQVLVLLQAEAENEFRQYDQQSPMHVVLVDKDGNYYHAGGSSVSMTGGGGSNDPTEQHKISDVDDASNPKYYGYTDRDGHWYIMKENTTNKTYRYAAGPNNYTTNWTNRASLTYDYFYNVF